MPQNELTKPQSLNQNPEEGSGDPLFEADAVKERRLAALRRYDILDSAPEEAFDRLTELAADLFRIEVAFVAFLDTDRKRFQSSMGLDRTERGLVAAFCTFTVETDGLLVIEDAADDDWTDDGPFGTDAGLRFYAGVPIRATEGEAIGTFSIMDTEPRALSEEEGRRLEDLAQMASEDLEQRRKAREHEQLARRFEAVLQDPNALVGMLSPVGTLFEVAIE